MELTAAFIEEYSKKQGETLRDVEFLRMEKVGITRISENVFPLLKNLVRLDLSRNLISSLSHFQYLHNLEILILYYNRVEKCTELKFLQSNTHLRELDLRLNPITTVTSYPTLAVSILPNLKRLDQHNLFSKAPKCDDSQESKEEKKYTIFPSSVNCSSHVSIEEDPSTPKSLKFQQEETLDGIYVPSISLKSHTSIDKMPNKVCENPDQKAFDIFHSNFNNISENYSLNDINNMDTLQIQIDQYRSEVAMLRKQVEHYETLIHTKDSDNSNNGAMICTEDQCMPSQGDILPSEENAPSKEELLSDGDHGKNSKDKNQLEFLQRGVETLLIERKVSNSSTKVCTKDLSNEEIEKSTELIRHLERKNKKMKLTIRGMKSYYNAERGRMIEERQKWYAIVEMLQDSHKKLGYCNEYLQGELKYWKNKYSSDAKFWRDNFDELKNNLMHNVQSP